MILWSMQADPAVEQVGTKKNKNTPPLDDDVKNSRKQGVLFCFESIVTSFNPALCGSQTVEGIPLRGVTCFHSDFK